MQAQAGAGDGAPGQQQRGQQQGTSWRGLIFQVVVMYLVFNYFFGSNTQKAALDPSTGKALEPHHPLWHGGERLQLRVFASEQKVLSPADLESLPPLWAEDDLYYDYRPSNERVRDIVYKPSPEVMANATLWAHIYLVQDGYPLDPSLPEYKKSAVIYRRHMLNQYAPKPKLKGLKNLISGELEDDPELLKLQDTIAVPEIISYWKPNLTLDLVYDFTVHPRGGLPPPLDRQFQFDTRGRYYPVLYPNDFWLLREYLYPINETTTELPLHLEYRTISLWKWQLYVQMQQSFEMQEGWGSYTEGESDDIKRLLLDTNPWLLGLTITVSILHSVFDFLAFKNDISFWKNKKNLEGLSVRTIFVNCIMQLIILLYLFDNDTSWIILISATVGLVIEAWKITKAVEVTVTRRYGLPWLSFKDKASYSAKTKEHDEVAMYYLSYVLYVLVIGYAIYSLIYENHKSWYSWVLGSLTGCIYTFGFVMMMPQLFINYKLKSVAHMPWKTFVYKALNTFVDDLFAFIIRMPTLHRVACFRDDIVFLIFLYQRWIYPVDKTRVNEFGQSGEDDIPAEQVPQNAVAAVNTNDKKNQ